jgi:hypothetical protein
MINLIKIVAPSWLRMLGVATGVLIVSTVGCANPVKTGGEDRRMAAKSIQEVLEEHSDQWMSIPGVVGTAIGRFEGKPCIRVLAANKTDQVTQQIPSELEGFPVIITETGEIRALE